MFELYQLRYFMAVVETGNFTKAAERACVTQPTLSAGIKKLEQQLDTQLFHRSSRRVFLTEAGTRFQKRARTILFECNQASADLTEVESRQILRLGLLRTVPGSRVANLLGDFRRNDPRVVIELSEGTEQEISNRLADGGVDAAITILREGEHHGATRLYDEGYRLFVANDHPLADSVEVRGEDFASDTMLVRTRCEVLSETSRYFTDRNVRPRLVYKTEQDERALEMVAAGIGVTVMPQSYAHVGVTKLILTGFEHRRTIGLIRSPIESRSENIALVEQFDAFTASQSW